MLKEYFNKDNLVTVAIVVVGTVLANLFITAWVAKGIAKAKEVAKGN